MELQSLIRDYKQALSDYELAEKRKSYLREQFLRLIEWKPGTYGDILVLKAKQAPIVEWLDLARDEKIGPDLIDKYTIYRPEILKVSVKRTLNTST